MNMKVALVACGRLENRYVAEWVEHYKQLGFDHIFIADNNREGEEHFEDVLQSYINDQFVTIYDYKNIDCWIHYACYLDIYYKISNNYDWVAFYDMDEFLTLVEDNNIKKYLSRDCFKNTNQILINWKTYTDNNLVYDDGRPLLERFTTPMELNKKAEPNDWCITNMCIKSMIRTNISNLEYATMHCFNNELLKTTTSNNCGESITNITYFQPINYNLAYIKHFPTKTIEEFIKNKQVRGISIPDNENIKSISLNRFFKYNDITEEKLKYLKNNNIKYINIALVACGRLENRYAVEWVEYYKQLGFDHIFIADNNREGEEHFEDVLQSYIDDQFVTIYDYRNLDIIQVKSYNDIYYKISNDYDWVAFFDFDEYLTLVEDNNIKNYLSRDCFKNANQILINWKTYTDNDLVYDDGRPCLERFTTPMELNKKAEPNDWCITNSLCKSIIKAGLKNIYLSEPHLCTNESLKQTTYNNKGNKINELWHVQPINYDLAYIKHFTTKTIEEWIKNKSKRGTGASSKELFSKNYDVTRFFKYNNVTIEKLKYLKDNNII